jgi:hypothetical protein
VPGLLAPGSIGLPAKMQGGRGKENEALLRNRRELSSNIACTSGHAGAPPLPDGESVGNASVGEMVSLTLFLQVYSVYLGSNSP